MHLGSVCSIRLSDVGIANCTTVKCKLPDTNCILPHPSKKSKRNFLIARKPVVVCERSCPFAVLPGFFPVKAQIFRKAGVIRRESKGRLSPAKRQVVQAQIVGRQR